MFGSPHPSALPVYQQLTNLCERNVAINPAHHNELAKSDGTNSISETSLQGLTSKTGLRNNNGHGREWAQYREPSATAPAWHGPKQVRGCDQSAKGPDIVIRPIATLCI